jgi:hypothetical protein
MGMGSGRWCWIGEGDESEGLVNGFDARLGSSGHSGGGAVLQQLSGDSPTSGVLDEGQRKGSSMRIEVGARSAQKGSRSIRAIPAPKRHGVERGERY